MSIGPPNWSRSISNFDIVLLNTRNHWMVSDGNFNGWIFVYQKLFLEILKSVLTLVSLR